MVVIQKQNIENFANPLKKIPKILFGGLIKVAKAIVKVFVKLINAILKTVIGLLKKAIMLIFKILEKLITFLYKRFKNWGILILMFITYMIASNIYKLLFNDF